VAPLIKGKKYRAMLTEFTDTLRVSKNFRNRQLYLHIAISTYTSDKDIFKKHFAKNIAIDMENEKCKCVLIMLAKLCNVVEPDFSKSVEKIRSKLLAESDSTILQYMPTDAKGNQFEKQRRYLALNYGSEKVESEETELTEEEWLAKE
jgi:hypothetical protein